MSGTKEPFQNGLFVKNGRGALLAGRCPSCGRVFFPRREACPECGPGELEPLELTGPASLYSYTRVMMPVHKYKPPFTLAWVEFPEQVRVMGQVREDGGELTLGMKMRLTIDTLWSEDDKDFIGYKFEPVR